MNVIQRLSRKCVQKKYALPCQTKTTYLLLSLLTNHYAYTFTDALTLIHPPADGASTISVFEVMKVAQLGSLALSRNLSMSLPPDYTPFTLAEVFYMATMGGAQGINLSYYKWSPLYSCGASLLLLQITMCTSKSTTITEIFLFMQQLALVTQLEILRYVCITKINNLHWWVHRIERIQIACQWTCFRTRELWS